MPWPFISQVNDEERSLHVIVVRLLAKRRVKENIKKVSQVGDGLKDNRITDSVGLVVFLCWWCFSVG